VKLGDIVWFNDSYPIPKGKTWGYIISVKTNLIKVRLFSDNTTEVLFISTKGNFWDNA
jgi:hypothetical protein